MLFANYDSNKVKAVLEAVESTERKAWFEGMGINVENATSMESALKISGLDFEVEKRPVYFSNEGKRDKKGHFMPPYIKVENMEMTVRTDTNIGLGVVTPKFEILQNRDAFDFLDSLVVGGAKFETAGLFKKNGAASYVTMSTEPIKILGDDFNPYMMIVNGHDGGTSVRVCITPVRAVCRNTAILALKKATSTVSIHHSKKMYDKLEVAKEVLLANSKYMEALKEEAEKLAVTPFSAENFEAMAKKLFPVNQEDSEIIQIRNLAMIERLLKAYQEDDLQNFNNTAWKAVQAVSDFESHKPSFRKSTKVANNGTAEFQVVMNMSPLVNKVWEMVKAN